MRCLGFILLFCVIILIMTSLNVGGSKHHRHHKSHNYKVEVKNKRSVSEEPFHVKLPRIIRRKFAEWSTSPGNFTSLYHSIPIDVTHIKDDMFLLTAPYRKSKSIILNARLWMEFPGIDRSSELQSNKYLIDITPVIGSRDMDGYDDCSTVTIVSKVRFPEDILEMKFDITSVYQACQAKDDSTYFKFKLRFYSFSNTTDIDFTKDKVDMFLLFKEQDQIDDIMHFLPNSESIEPLHYERVMHRVPQLRSFRPRRKGSRACSLKPFTFNFDDSGWRNYVVAPKEYQSNKCHGRCSFPLPDHLNSTNYAVMKAVASTIYEGMNNPYCIAQDLAPLTMLVCDEDFKITLKSQKDMIATSCKCA